LRRLTRLDEKRCHELLPLLQPDETSFERILEIKDILNSSDDPEIKGIVIRIMGYSGNESVVPVLTEYLQDPDSRIRAESVEALMDTGVEYVVELIQPMLNDFDNRVRANVAKGLWKLGGLTVLQSLKEMTQHSDKWMRASAAYALGEIGVIQVIDILRPVLNDPDVDVKINVVKALIKTGDKTAIEAVMEVAENRAADWIVRKTAVLALASLKTTEVLEFLQKLRNNDETNSHLTELVSIIFSEVKRQDSGLE
jgi:HEAT repeat protein